MFPLRQKKGPAEFPTHKSNHLNSSTAVFYTSIIFGKNISCSLRSDGPGGFTIEGMIYLLVFCVYFILKVPPYSHIFESVWKDQGSFRLRSSRFNFISATPLTIVVSYFNHLLTARQLNEIRKNRIAAMTTLLIFNLIVHKNDTPFIWYLSVFLNPVSRSQLCSP